MAAKLSLFVVFVCLLLTSGGDYVKAPRPKRTVQSARPNFVVIVLDDADMRMFTDASLAIHFPNIGRIAQEGIQFTNCHVTTPICAPSRASFLRGQYAHNTGVCVNDATIPFANGFPGGFPAFKPLASDDLGVWFKRAGYHTMLVGKYLHNNYDFSVPPGWDDFYASLGGIYFETYQFTTRMVPTGQTTQLAKNQYRTTVEGNDAISLMQRHLTGSQASQPFFLYLTPLAPHDGIPRDERVEPKYASWWTQMRLPLTDDVNEADVSDKPAVVANLPRLDSNQMELMNRAFRDRMLSVKSVDDLVGRIYATLEAEDALDNTYIVFTSDHGFLTGQHRVYGKSFPYDLCTRVPLFIRGPQVAQQTVANHLLAQIDLPPTLLKLAGAPVPSFVDGRSFAPLLTAPAAHAEASWREPILIEHWERTNTLGTQVDTTYCALRMYDELYVEWADGADEYYDLRSDPLELDNAIDHLDPAVQAMFSEQLRAIRADGRPPRATLTLPSYQSNPFIRLDSLLNGFAEDDTGVERVRLIIRDLQTQRFWNGNSWQPDYTQVAAELSRERGMLTSWHYRLNLAETTNQDMNLAIVARSVDVNGQVSPVSNPLVLNIDTAPPETSIAKPASGAVLPGEARITGQASDNHEISHVGLTLKDLQRRRYWNGSGWTSDRTVIDLKVSPDGKWHLIQALPPGRYAVWARAYDVAGNFDSTPASVDFYVQ